jgi:hypothetical protein
LQSGTGVPFLAWVALCIRVCLTIYAPNWLDVSSSIILHQ